MGKKNIYTVKDYRTGKVLARGTAYELETSGIVPKGCHASKWAKLENDRMKGRRYNISAERWTSEEEKKHKPKGRPINIYTCYDAAGDVIGRGTARELWEKGVFNYEGGAYYTYTEQGGKCRKLGIARMDCEKEMRQYIQNNAQSEKKLKPERPVLRLRRISDPTPLDYDVHDLMLYNAIARKEGHPELTYGYWAAAGKPSRP